MHVTIQPTINLLSSLSFVHEPKDLPVCPNSTRILDAGQPPPILPLTLIQHPFKEGLEGAERDSLYQLGRIFLYIFAVPIERVRSAIQ